MHNAPLKTVLFVLLLACACRTAESSAAAPELPSIEFRGFEPSANGMREFPVFELVNHTQESFTYNKQDGSPVFFTYDLGKPNRADGWLMCGTGITDQPFNPGDSISLRAWHWETALGPIQVRITVGNSADERLEIISEEVGIGAAKAQGIAVR